ncbi:MAG: lipoprotein [Burkholderiaceae bacterium]|nr:lipoprotein [Burkholderiaceae bacterium]MEB2350233.1 lipoprotein [Burkholderiaceae bacterium]
MPTAGQCIARAAPRRRAPRRFVAVAAAAVVLVLLAACGQRGPLYLPDSQPKKKLAVNPGAFAAVASPRH